jgi:enamine deaminase RidA (YjgF/YER057c/UK114 family)
MRRCEINPWTWQERFHYEQAVKVTGGQRTLYCAGQISTDADGNPQHAGDMTAQCMLALDNLEKVLRDADMTLANVVRYVAYVRSVDDYFLAKQIFGPRLDESGCRAASTLIQVAALAWPDLLVEFEATAVA